MTNRGVAVLGLRLFALYLCVQSLIMLPQAYALVAGSAPADNVEYWLSAAAYVGPVLIGLLLWLGAGPMASVLLPQRTAAAPAPQQPGCWYPLPFAAVGLLVTIGALSSLLEVAAAAHRRVLALEALGPELSVALIAESLRLSLGLAALFGSRGFANLVLRLRTSGLAHAVSS
jgi:hypothetical protein